MQNFQTTDDNEKAKINYSKCKLNKIPDDVEKAKKATADAN